VFVHGKINDQKSASQPAARQAMVDDSGSIFTLAFGDVTSQLELAKNQPIVYPLGI
jgi:hypothetical protein